MSATAAVAAPTAEVISGQDSARKTAPRLKPVKQLLEQVFSECDKIATQNIGSTQSTASILQKLSLIYYLDVRMQALLSFGSALGAAVVGMAFFFYAGWLSMSAHGASQSVNISLWAGALTQFISAVSFFLYFKAARQFATFHVCLERMNRYLLANTISDGLDDETKSKVRGALVETIAGAPMLSLDPAAEIANKPAKRSD
jgi:hypothetical protein